MLAKEKMQPELDIMKFESQSVKTKSKKNKDRLEGIFGKGKRLPVFNGITFSTKDANKKKKKNKNKNKEKKAHKFNK